MRATAPSPFHARPGCQTLPTPSSRGPRLPMQATVFLGGCSWFFLPTVWGSWKAFPSIGPPPRGPAGAGVPGTDRRGLGWPARTRLRSSGYPGCLGCPGGSDVARGPVSTPVSTGNRGACDGWARKKVTAFQSSSPRPVGDREGRRWAARPRAARLRFLRSLMMRAPAVHGVNPVATDHRPCRGEEPASPRPGCRTRLREARRLL